MLLKGRGLGEPICKHTDSKSQLGDGMTADLPKMGELKGELRSKGLTLISSPT